jgi:hypothetical protein
MERDEGPPLTLANMRALGITQLDVWCRGRDCLHHRKLDLEGYPDDLPAPTIILSVA